VAIAIPAAIAAAGAVAGYLNQKKAADATKGVAQENLQYQKDAAASQQAFAREVLAMSKPNISSEDLGNLLFQQGAQQRQISLDNSLQTLLRGNLRAGSPSSAGELVAAANSKNASTMGDLRSSSTLQGILGTLPSAAAIGTAGNLYQTQTPQNSWQPDYTALPQFLGNSANILDSLMSKYAGSSGGGYPTSSGGYSTVPGYSNDPNYLNNLYSRTQEKSRV
jgi:hypothetical protein